MDILDIFWTFHLNHLSPLWGYFHIIKKNDWFVIQVLYGYHDLFIQ